MQTVIYAGLRNGERDQKIHDALIYSHVAEVAREFQLAPNTVRAAAKRIQNAVVFDLYLLGGGSRCGSERSRQIHSEKPPLGHTAIITEPLETLTCPAG